MQRSLALRPVSYDFCAIRLLYLLSRLQFRETDALDVTVFTLALPFGCTGDVAALVEEALHDLPQRPMARGTGAV